MRSISLIGKRNYEILSHSALLQEKGTEDMAKGKMFCNVCGKPIDQICEDQAVVSIHNRIGYGSKYDGDEIDLDICCDCFDKLIDDFTEKCAINPIKEIL
jgi:hypothetical protein